MSQNLRVYRCPICNALWLRHQLIGKQLESWAPVLTCPQDGAEVINATNTPRGKRFLQAVNEQEKRSPDVTSKV